MTGLQTSVLLKEIHVICPILVPILQDLAILQNITDTEMDEMKTMLVANGFTLNKK